MLLYISAQVVEVWICVRTCGCGCGVHMCCVHVLRGSVCVGDVVWVCISGWAYMYNKVYTQYNFRLY